MKYDNYKASRDAGWELLLKYKIDKLPIKISAICKKEGIHIHSYQKAHNIISHCGFQKEVLDNDGFSVILAGEKYIFYNSDTSIGRQRFTIAHELGHFLLGHVSNIPTRRNKEPSENDSPIEQEANIIASRILSPACVLWGIGVTTSEQIQEICQISKKASEWRMKRLEKLYEREKIFLKNYGYSCFCLSPLERQVYNQFEDYIKYYKNKL